MRTDFEVGHGRHNAHERLLLERSFDQHALELPSVDPGQCYT